MPQLQYPQSDLKRVLLLEQAIATATQDHAEKRDYASTRWLGDAQTFVADFGAKVRELGKLKGVRGQEVIEKDEAIAEIQRYVRDFWGVLRRRIARLKQPASLFQIYNLPQSGENPSESAAAIWIERGAGLIAADATAVEMGYPAMLNPSAPELQVVLDKAKAEFADVPMADRKVDVMQHELDELRPRALKLIRALSAQLDASLYDLSNESVRRVKGTYGFEYYTPPDERGEGDASEGSDVGRRPPDAEGAELGEV